MEATENLTWNLSDSRVWVLYLLDAEGMRYGYVRHHDRSTAANPTYIGVVLVGGARQVTRTFGGEPTIAAAQAAVIKEIA